MIKKNKRMLTVLLAVVMLLSTLLPLTVSAAEVTMDLEKAEVSWDYTLTDQEGNNFTATYGLAAEDNPFGYRLSVRTRTMHDYTAKRPGLTGSKSDWEYGKDYVYCFCIEHGIALPDSESYSGSPDETHGNKYEALSVAQRDLLALALAYGYPNRTDTNTSKDANACYSATQLIVWQITLGFRTSATELDDKTYPGEGYEGTMTEQYTTNPYLKDYYDRILSDMTAHYSRPGFTSNVPSAAYTYEMQYVNGKYTVALTDTNNVLSDYFVSQNNGISTTISGNTLTLSSSAPIDGAVTVKLNRKMPRTTYTTGFLIWSVEGNEASNQDMVSGVPANNDPVPAYLKLRSTDGSVKIVKQSEDCKLDGIKFNIVGDGVDETVVTANGGEIQIDHLRPGIYRITEVTDNIYEPQETQTVTVISGQTVTVTFNNTLKRGDLTVIKTAEDGLTEGAKFHLYGTADCGQKVDEYAIVDNTGKAYFKNVLMGRGYVLEEVDTGNRYVVPEQQTVDIEWNTVTGVSVSNTLKKWNVTVTKHDSENGEAQGDATLEGAVYGVYEGDTLIDTYTTDHSGQFTTDYYVCGDDWSIREITPSEGYLLDSTIYHVGAEAKLYTVEYNSIAADVTEQVVKGKISLIKHTDNGDTQLETPEVGAEFEIYLKSAGAYANTKESERDYLICDENGFAETKFLPYGIYTVHQVSGWDGRALLADFDVYIAEDGRTYRYLANNAFFQSHIKIVKVDAESGNAIPYAGAGFRLYYPDGTPVTQTLTYPEVTVVDTFYTNDMGYLITPESLPYGEGYSFVEVYAPYGYVLNSDSVYFDVTAENATEENAVTVVEVKKSNSAQRGVIKITKTGEVFVTVTECDGIYQPIYKVQGMPEAVYEIRAAEDIVTPDGTLRYAVGEVVDTVTTDEMGNAISKSLYLGRYEVREIAAPYGLVLNDEIYIVELVYAGQEIEITETSVDLYNERQKVAVTLDKLMEQNERFGIGQNGEITAVTFGLYAATELTAADGSVIPADGLIEILSVSENGTAACKTDLPFGNYYLKEIATDSHYILADAQYAFAFEYAGQEIPLVEIKANDDMPIINDLIYGEIRGRKTDDNGNALGGALIGLFAPNTTEFTSDHAILTAASAEDGSFSFVNVPYGDWIVREIEAPTGFVLSDDVYSVTIDADGAIIEVAIENSLICGSVQLTKVDKDYPDNKLTGAEFEIYRDSNGNKQLDVDDEKTGLLEEIDMGIYEMHDLPYGGYFVKESQAPEGFQLDEKSYYFEITEQDKIVIVENEAGKGFVNQLRVGSLKIIKTSSDGKVEGFSFRVTGPNGYDEEFITDEKGEILIEGLRAGEYTVSEISDEVSADYILPNDNNATVMEGGTTNVVMHNVFRDTPKTGDDSDPILWAVLLGVSAIGTITLGLLGFKDMRKEDGE